MTNKQLKDLETVKYFIPDCMRGIEISDKNLEMFFEYSERGKNKQKRKNYGTDGFNSLCEGKRWRGIHMQMYEDGVLDGSMPYAVILQDTPRVVVDFMKKEMFKGVDGELIERCYQTL